MQRKNNSPWQKLFQKFACFFLNEFFLVHWELKHTEALTFGLIGHVVLSWNYALSAVVGQFVDKAFKDIMVLLTCSWRGRLSESFLLKLSAFKISILNFVSYFSPR